ncbi:MAG: hypothetical protein R3E39_30080 [Anaerolineae bacterium]
MFAHKPLISVVFFVGTGQCEASMWDALYSSSSTLSALSMNDNEAHRTQTVGTAFLPSAAGASINSIECPNRHVLDGAA